MAMKSSLAVAVKACLLCGFAALCFAPAATAQSGRDLSGAPVDVLHTQSLSLHELTSDRAPLTEYKSSSYDPYILGKKSRPTEPNRNGPIDAATLNAAIEPVIQSKADTRVHWMPAIMESLYYTGVMHAFRFPTEAGTRDTLNGHWFRNYTDSLAALRGWSDGDTFMAPYVGHSLEGSIFGYIFRQNDPRYKNVQWGDGRDYFVSVLRSMAWSAVWHTQWKIGPASEASLGNIMLHASPGFIDLANTPTLGAVTMIVEDFTDRHMMIGIENRTTNRPLIILTRSFLNPGRSFANLMAFHVPWRRETRMGLYGEAGEARRAMVRAYKAGLGPKPFEFEPRSKDKGIEFNRTFPKEAPIELAAFPVYETFLGGSCIGGGGSGAARVNPSFQVVTEVSGCQVMHMPHYNQSGDSLFYGGGVRWTPRASRTFSPYAEFLFGGRKVTYEVDDLELRKKLLKEWNDGNGTRGHYPKRKDWSIEIASNGPTIVAGGGLDVVLSRAFAWRALKVQYMHSWMDDVQTIHPQNGVRVTSEAVLRIGTW